MKRESNVTVWQLGLFDGLDRDVMVMQRDEQEVFDDAIHVFFEREYYDAYVSKAKKYSEHGYAYHEDKLGEVIYQIFDEDITGMVFHVGTQPDAPKNMLCEEKYISAEDLMGIRDAVEGFHYMYTVSIDRMTKEEAVAKLWTKNVYIIGNIPDFRRKPEGQEKQSIELMTMKRKNDGSFATAKDYDYESLKVFLTSGSAMRFNPDKKPVNKYKLSFLSQFVKGRLQIVMEPHRNYYLEFNPATIDISKYLQTQEWNEDKVKARIKAYRDMEQVYILLAPLHSDYRSCVGIPFMMKLDEQNVMMYLFEKYEDAVAYCIQNPTMLPVLDGTYPIGILKKKDKMTCLNTVVAIASNMGVTAINMDMETEYAIGSKLEFFRETSGIEADLDKILTSEECAQIRQEKDGKMNYRYMPISFVDTRNPYAISEERQAELKMHVDDVDYGLAFMAGCTVPEMLVMLREVGTRFDEARNKQDEELAKKYNMIMNRMTVPLTEELCEMPFIYTLREDNGDFTLRNNIAYLIVTNRFESGRSGEGKIMPVSVGNEQFMEKLLAASKVAAVTDGPNLLALADVRLMLEVAKQKKKSESLREELIIYMTQGLGLSYQDAIYYYKKLKTDNSIFVEFTTCVRNGEYSPMMINVEGYTAKMLADEKGLNPLQAYEMLLELKVNPKSMKGNKTTDTKETSDGQAEEEKKSFFGKLFRK